MSDACVAARGKRSAFSFLRTKQWMQNEEWDGRVLRYLPESIVADMYGSGMVPEGVGVILWKCLA